MEEYKKLFNINQYVKKSINSNLKETTLRDKLKVATELYNSILLKINENKDQLSTESLKVVSDNIHKWYLQKTKREFMRKSKEFIKRTELAIIQQVPIVP